MTWKVGIRKVLLAVLTIVYVSHTYVAFAGGDMDLSRYCIDLGYVGVVLVEQTAYGFRCQDSSGGLHDLDMYDVCNTQYPGSKPTMGDYNNPYSWRCEGQTHYEPPPIHLPDNGILPSSGQGNSGNAAAASASNSGNSGSTSYVTNSCSGAVMVGDQARITPGRPNNLREAPSKSGRKITEIPGGTGVSVVGGPSDADGYRWWQVNYGGTIGWTAEGNSSGLWLECVNRTSAVQGNQSAQSGPYQTSKSTSVIPIDKDGSNIARLDYSFVATYVQSGSSYTITQVHLDFLVDPSANARLMCSGHATIDLLDETGAVRDHRASNAFWFIWGGNDPKSVDFSPNLVVGSNGKASASILFDCLQFLSDKDVGDASRSPAPLLNAESEIVELRIPQ